MAYHSSLARRKLPEGTKSVGELTPEKIFIKRIAEQEKIATQQYLPFCRACAWNKMKDAIEMRKRDIARETGAVFEDHPEYLKVAEELSIEEFLGEKAHNKINESPQSETKVTSMGRRETNIVGYYMEYECKKIPTMHKCSVFIPLDEYEIMKSAVKQKPARTNTPPIVPPKDD